MHSIALGHCPERQSFVGHIVVTRAHPNIPQKHKYQISQTLFGKRGALRLVVSSAEEFGREYTKSLIDKLMYYGAQVKLAEKESLLRCAFGNFELAKDIVTHLFRVGDNIANKSFTLLRYVTLSKTRKVVKTQKSVCKVVSCCSFVIVVFHFTF